MTRLLFLSALLSFSIFSVQAREEVKAPVAPAPKITENKSRFEQLELFNKVLFLIENQYYRPVSTEKLIEGALKGMMDTLDPHSAFLNKDFFEKMQNDTKGEFGGLGLEVTQKEGVIYIITPIDDTPAFRAGIKPKDKLVEINHEPIVGMTLEQAIEKMRGEVGEKINLGIIREGVDGVKYFTLTREIIKVKPVKFELVADKYAFIRLTQFQKRSTSSVEEALKTLKAKAKGDLAGIILDLRSNPGGLLDQAVDVTSLFLKEGVVVTTESRDPQNKEIRYVKKSGLKDLTTPMVVLINGASASASEIVAGALQDYQRAVIMGSRSFGKGSVQTVAQLDKHTGVKLTIAQYMTPKNRKIQAVGIIPDVEVEEVDQDAFQKTSREDRYIREKDLQNHLTATIETPKEKTDRQVQERKDRALKIKEMEGKKAKTVVKDKDDELFKSYNPREDFQVLQAVKYLQGFNVYESFIKNNKK
ncbi:MAG TPA: S41 family peptidase [Bacteriovoracaceae bacterium]|nr:S41 family peptidase [Bacteriovoracaceae bacterium]